MNFKDNLAEYKCLCCNKYHQTIFDENLRKQFVNTYIYFNHDINKFILLLRKGFYPYKSMHDQERFSETTSPDKENFYSHLNMEDITDADQTKIFCKDFQINNLEEYHGLYHQKDTLLIADIFENFRKIYLEIYEFDLACFLTAPGLA